MIRPDLEEKLRHLARTAGFEAVSDYLVNQAVECANILIVRDCAGPSPTGSFIGSRARLPPYLSWPSKEVSNVDGEPATFIAQFDLSEIPAVGDIALPAHGMLWLFAKSLEFTHSQFTAIYDPNSSNANYKAADAQEVPDGGRNQFPQVHIRFKPGFSLPFFKKSFRDQLHGLGTFSGDFADLMRAINSEQDVIGQIGGFSQEPGWNLYEWLAFSALGREDCYYIADCNSIEDYKRARRRPLSDEEVAEAEGKFDWLSAHKSEIDAQSESWSLLVRICNDFRVPLEIGNSSSLEVYIRKGDLATNVYTDLWGEFPQ